MSVKLIEAKNLKKSFGDFVAVDNINLDVERGEVVGFLGPNGAGKSTTMKMLTGFLEPDGGEIFIEGIDLKSKPLEAKKSIGYLPEGAPSYSDMEVSEFLSLVGKMRGLNNNGLLNTRLSDMAEQINLKEVWHKPIETLSKGFKRRVGIAQALIHDPDILILDEPTDGLDPNQKYEMRDLIKKISTNKAIVISTHILEEVEAVCSRTVIIANGQLLANETPDNLGKQFNKKNMFSLKVGKKLNNTQIKDIKSSLDYKKVTVKNLNITDTLILIEDEKENINLNKIMTQLKKYKLDINEANFVKPSLDDIFRKITQ
ncbi:MAG: ABC transporter ATP-binding protein [Alphaproteobacteria bacterium]|nr:ABC transporter ATP-binding protein [Alphaproteobacteria bacterium]